MAWPHNKRSEGKKDAWSLEEPSSKKRRMGLEETMGDDWGDDSLELTQAEIETIDVMASQALSSSQVPKQSEPFARPTKPVNPSSHSHNRSSTSSTSSMASSSSSLSLRPKSFTSSSLSSGNSVQSVSSHSSASNGTSTSLPPRHSSSGKVDPVEGYKAELEKKDLEIQNALDEKYRSDGEVKYLRQTLQKKESEMEQLRAQKNAEDEQWRKRQMDSERKLKLQVDKLTSEAHFKEREYQESIQVLEKKLKEKDDKKKSIPSDASPIRGMKLSQESKGDPKPSTSSPQKKSVKPSPPSKLRQQQKGDDVLSSSQIPEFPTQSSFMERPQGQSPKAKTSLVLRQTKSVSCQAQSASTETPETSHPTPCHPKRMKMRRLQLKKASSGASSGPEIVSELIRPSGTSANEGEPGLPGLLQAMSTSLTLDSLTYSRNKDNSFLSPLKPQRRSHLPGSVPSVSGGPSSSSSNSNLVQVVCPDNFHLAIQGLDMLLRGTQNPDRPSGNDPKNSTPSPSSSSSSPSSKSVTVTEKASLSSKGKGKSSKIFLLASGLGVTPLSATNSSSSTSSSSPLDADHPYYGAVLLLPMLSDYLHHYLHHTVAKTGVGGASKSPVTTPVTNIRTSSHHNSSIHHRHSLHHSGQSTSGGGLDSVSLFAGSGSSYDSSLDSLSSSVIHLLQEGKVYAATMEKYAVSALQSLSLLIQLCPAVTSVMAHSSLMDSKVAVQAVSKQDAGVESTSKKVESGTDADDEKSTSSSEIRIIAGFNTRRLMTPFSSHPSISLHNQSRLLLCVTKLAAENLEESNVSPLVVGESLRALNHLCNQCNTQELMRLEHVMIKEALSSSLRQTKHPQILVESQRLCGLLIHHPSVISRLCTKSEHCPLYHMYRLCADPQVDKLHHVSTQIYSQHVNILSSIISQHRSGVGSLLLNSCACTDELVVSTILAMYKLFKTLKKQQPSQPPSPPPPPYSSPSSSPSSSTQDPTTFTLLLQGILVLHCLAQADGAFCQRHSPVQLSYVRLLTGLANLIKPIRAQWEWHATVLDELCDFEPEFQESSSQDSENEDRMDQA